VDEFELISAITQTLRKNQPRQPQQPDSRPAPALTLDIETGDDAAALSVTKGCTIVWSVDAFTEGVHFRRQWVIPLQLGHRVVAASAADVVAMGATPNFALITLACPADVNQEWVLALAEGLGSEASALGMQIVGGDVSVASEIHITSSVLGTVPAGMKPVTRAGAKAGDTVAIRGPLGLAAAGLAVNESDLPQAAHQALRDAYAYPKLEKNTGVNAAAAGATSMIDVSDGLIADAGHIANASNVTIDIATRQIHLSPNLVQAAAQLGLDATALALTGGDDHAIVATFPEGASLPEGFEVIGSVRESSNGGKVLVDGAPFTQMGGYRHFS